MSNILEADANRTRPFHKRRANKQCGKGGFVVHAKSFSSSNNTLFRILTTLIFNLLNTR